MQNEDKNYEQTPWPGMDILPGIGWVKRLGGKMIRFIYFFPVNAPDYTSEHFKGGGPTLDEGLYDREHSLGHLVMNGDISSQQASDWLGAVEWVERATLFPNDKL